MIARTRFISLGRFLDVSPEWNRQVDPTGFSFTSYDAVRDDHTRWTVVADDDPRAETVIHHEERVS